MPTSLIVPFTCITTKELCTRALVWNAHLSSFDSLVLWHINHCGLVNAKFSLYILDIFDLKTHLVDNIFKRTWGHLLHTVKLSQELIFNSYYSSLHYSFFCTQLNGSKYCYVSVQLNINHLFTHSLMIKQFYFKQFNLAEVICFHSVWMSNSSIWPIDRTLSNHTNIICSPIGFPITVIYSSTASQRHNN